MLNLLISKKNPKTTYMEIVNWMKIALHNLQTVEVQTLQTNTNHNILLAKEENQNDKLDQSCNSARAREHRSRKGFIKSAEGFDGNINFTI